MKRVLVALALATTGFWSAADAQVAFNLSSGWNLLGNSSSAPINVASAFADTSKFTTVWTWNKAASKWAFYAPSLSSSALATYAQGKGYDVLTSIGSKEGFWVNAATATTLNGPVASAVVLAESDLIPGWNLLGSADGKTPSQLNQGLSTSLSAAGKSMTTAWAWDATGTAWRFYAPSLDAQGGTALADYIASKQYRAFTAALSNSDGFWMNIGASSGGSSTSTTTSTTSTSTSTTAVTTTTTTTIANAAFVEAPVVNTPLDGVDVTLTCSSGLAGGSGKASQGSVKIAVDSVNCAPPYTMAVSGTGTMAGPDLKFGTSDDEAYDSTTRAALKSVIQASDLGLNSSSKLTAGTTTAAPAITALTTMVAFALPPNPGATDFVNAIAKVQSVAGLSDPSLVYANPLTNGAVFNAATLVNEMVANAVTADPTLKPNDLLKNMALTTTAKLTDATIDPVKLMGASAAATTVLDAQIATMQAKAQAMQSVADAIKAAAPSGTTNLNPADALAYLNTALAGSSASAAQQAIAQAQLAQNTMKQMTDQMATMRVDTNILPADLAARMAAMAQGLDSVRATQDTNLQSAISNVGTNATATAIASAIQAANATANSMIIASGASLLSTVSNTNTAVANLTGTYMAAIAGSITQQLGQIDPTQLANATAGPPANLAAAMANIGANPATMATAAASTAGQVSNLIRPSELVSFPGLGDQVIGMVLARAATFGWMTSTQLQAWVNAIGTALAVNGVSSLNPGSVGFTLSNYFATSQPDLSKAPPTLTLTIVSIGATGGNGALPLCSTLAGTTTTANAGVNCTPNPTGTGGTFSLCSALPAGITPISSGTGQNCVASTGTLPSCMAIASTGTAPTSQNCAVDTNLPACSFLSSSLQFPNFTCTSGTGGTSLPACSILPQAQQQPGVNCTGSGTGLPACSTLPQAQQQPGVNCTGSGTGLPLCSTLPQAQQHPGTNCI